MGIDLGPQRGGLRFQRAQRIAKLRPRRLCRGPGLRCGAGRLTPGLGGAAGLRRRIGGRWVFAGRLRRKPCALVGQRRGLRLEPPDARTLILDALHQRRTPRLVRGDPPREIVHQRLLARHRLGRPAMGGGVPLDRRFVDGPGIEGRALLIEARERGGGIGGLGRFARGVRGNLLEPPGDLGARVLDPPLLGVQRLAGEGQSVQPRRLGRLGLAQIGKDLGGARLSGSGFGGSRGVAGGGPLGTVEFGAGSRAGRVRRAPLMV